MNSFNNGLIFLAGPPCSGKSITGKLLATRLDLPFHDLDTLIEENASMTISRIFSRFDEEEFRRLESEALNSLLSTDERFVLALGGGCLLDNTNLLSVMNNGTIITLTASEDILRKRIGMQKVKRPLAAKGNAFIELLKARNEHYKSLPNRIDTSGITPEETVIEIISILGSGVESYLDSMPDPKC